MNAPLHTLQRAEAAFVTAIRASIEAVNRVGTDTKGALADLASALLDARQRLQGDCNEFAALIGEMTEGYDEATENVLAGLRPPVDPEPVTLPHPALEVPPWGWDGLPEDDPSLEQGYVRNGYGFAAVVHPPCSLAVVHPVVDPPSGVIDPLDPTEVEVQEIVAQERARYAERAKTAAVVDAVADVFPPGIVEEADNLAKRVEVMTGAEAKAALLADGVDVESAGKRAEANGTSAIYPCCNDPDCPLCGGSGNATEPKVDRAMIDALNAAEASEQSTPKPPANGRKRRKGGKP